MRPCWIYDRTGHLIRECKKAKPSGCQRCRQNHTLYNCPQRPQRQAPKVNAITMEVGQENEEKE